MDVRAVPISTEDIRLGQALKLAGIVGAGSEVKMILAGDDVRVNGVVERRRGRRLVPGDLIEFDGVQLRITVG